MLHAETVLSDALKSTTPPTGGVRAVATYQGVQTEVRLATSGTITFQGSAEVQATGAVTAFGMGNSLVPKSQTDPLATYGQELAVYRTVRVRGQQWEIPLGIYRITEASDPVEKFRGNTVLGWSVNLTLMDRFEMLKAGDFIAVESPKPDATVWDEIRRLALSPVQEALGSASVPPATVYQSHLDAIETLCGLLGGVPHLTREGVLTARRADAWLTETTAVFDIQGVISWSGKSSNDFYNQVQVSNANDATITAYSLIDDPSDPLSVQRAGPRTYKQSAPIYQTYDAAKAAADTILARVSTRRARTVTVECGPQALLLELGDVGWFRDPRQHRAVRGEVSQLRVPLDPTATIGVDVIVGIEEPW